MPSSLTMNEPDYQAILKEPFHKCARTGCVNRGIWGLKVCVPATGHRLFQHTPMQAFVNVVVCDSHIEDCEGAEFVTDALINYMTTAAKNANKVQPDFRRAFILGVPINTREWRMFTQHAEDFKAKGRQ